MVHIRCAGTDDLEKIKDIVYRTIEKIYPRYYPEGAVSFFLSHHNENNIMEDIKRQRVYILETSSECVGTVTIKGNGICRLFVLPGFQKRVWKGFAGFCGEGNFRKGRQGVHRRFFSRKGDLFKAGI